MARIAYLEPQTATGETKGFLVSLAQKSSKLNTLTKTLAYRPALLKAIGPLGQAVGGESM